LYATAAPATPLLVGSGIRFSKRKAARANHGGGLKTVRSVQAATTGIGKTLGGLSRDDFICLAKLRWS
jgi:hypothetical protein